MKQRIEIRNFGPIKHVDLDIKPFTLFIGPNASGKSTIAKLVYFFQTPKIWESLDQIKKHGTFDVNTHDLKESIASQFRWLWDIRALQDDFEVKYYQELNKQEPEHAITLKKDNGNLEVILADEYIQFIRDWLIKISGVDIHASEREKLKLHNASILEKMRANLPLSEEERASIWEEMSFSSNRQLLEMLLHSGVEKLPLFGTEKRNKRTLFIPAGRQILSLPTDSYPLFSEGRIEPLVEEFMKLVKKRKERSFHEFIRDELSKFEQSELQHEPEDTNWGLLNTVEMAIGLSDNILKGSYINTREGERIYFNDKQFVKLYEASSGQQESLWIVNLVYLLLWETCWSYSLSTYTIIEEPEAHLYPETQKAITELISLLANQGDNQVMITTHSPYILSALNNLLYAHKVGKTKPDEVAEVIDPLLWVDIDRVAAYKVEDGTIRNIVDRRTSDNLNGLDMIIPEEIDALPHDPIVEDYTRLFNLDDCNDAD